MQTGPTTGTGRYILIGASLLALTAGPVPAQEVPVDGPVSPDSAEAIRAGMVRPPPKPPFDAIDAIALPFRIAFYPLELLGTVTTELIDVAVDLLRPKDVSLLALLSQEGIHPAFGSIGPRSFVAAGVRVDRWSPLFLETAISLRGSQRHGIGLEFTHPTYRIETSYRFERDAEPHFWGIGPDSRRRNRTDYRWDRQLVSAAGSLEFESFRVAASVGWEDNRVARGFDGDTRDIQDLPEERQPFGVDERIEYLTLKATTAIDGTYWISHQRRGVHLDLGTAVYLGTAGTQSDFYRVSTALYGFLPLNNRQSLALRGLGELNRGRDGGVPFTHLASLGNEQGGRAYDRDRFRDRDLLALMSEWRYEVWRELHNRGRVESFVFADAGSVDGRLTDISFSQLRWSYGFGFRVLWDSQLRAITYLAVGDEGFRADLDFSWVY